MTVLPGQYIGNGQMKMDSWNWTGGIGQLELDKWNWTAGTRMTVELFLICDVIKCNEWSPMIKYKKGTLLSSNVLCCIN